MKGKLKLKKTLGQHLLTCPNVLHKIVTAETLTSSDSILEIGPGTGILTQPLLDTGANVTAVEYDPRMITKLQETMIPSNRLHLIQGDFAKIKTLAPFTTCVSNIPYQISSKVIQILCDHTAPFKSAVLMVQDEFAMRLLAKHGTQNYSRLSVNTQLQMSITSVMKVPPSAFTPPPKVNSHVIKLIKHDDHASVDWTAFDAMLRVLFIRKNKTLRALLSSKTAQRATVQLDLKEKVQELLPRLNLENHRPVQMSPAALVELYNAFLEMDVHFHFPR